MHIIINSIVLLWLQFKRQLLFWLLLLGFFSYEILALYDIQSPGQMLTSTSFLVQGGILAFLLFGVMVMRSEDKHQLTDLFLTIKDALLYKIISNILYGAIVAFGLSILSYLLFLSYYFLKGWPVTHFYLSAFLYFLLYFCIPFFISYCIGYLLAIIIKSKLIFPLTLIIWALIGPMNTAFIGTQWKQVTRWLNLGDPNPYGVYNSHYGFSIDIFYWLTHLLWIIILVVTYTLYLYKGKNLLEKKFAWLILSISSLLIMTIAYPLSLKWQLYVSGDESKKSREFYDISYYEKKSNYIENNNLTILSYDIDLDIDRLLKSRVKMVLMNDSNKDLKDFTLSLYHDLKIKSIRVGNEELKFKQDQDSIQIFLKKVWKSKTKWSLELEYEGSSSPLFYANQRAIYLPFYFNWLPSVDNKPSFIINKYGQLVRTNHQVNNFVSYKLKYSGKKPLYTNLEKEGENKWEGTSSFGLTLTTGELQSKKNGKSLLVFPGDIKGLKYNEFEFATKSLMDKISKDFNLSLPYPSKVMMVPTLSISDNSLQYQFVWYSPEILLLNYSDDSWLIDIPYIYTYWLVPALTWKYLDIVVEDPDFLQAFEIMYGYIYNKQNNIIDEGNKIEWYNSVPSTGTKKKVLMTLSDWLKEESNLDKKNKFCIEWFTMIRSGKVSWEDVQILLKKYRVGENVE
ncbi:hypothetical protein [Niallia sp. 01092]|uniref:hypothetical protein n=1 Tax=unclassified Niallia TaxID=2837522 RepID=UPI003FD44786